MKDFQLNFCKDANSNYVVNAGSNENEKNSCIISLEEFELLKNLWQEFMDREEYDECLPTEIRVTAKELGWIRTPEEAEEEEEILSDYLSDTYGYCHYGFEYDSSEDFSEYHIYNIHWDIDEEDTEDEGVTEEEEWMEMHPHGWWNSPTDKGI